jgi:hypothetical protein
MSDRISWSRGWRGIVLIAVGAVMGANLITPAVAHIGTTLTHLYSHTDQRYYKKSAVNQRITRLSGAHLSADVDNWDGTTITDARTIQAPRRGLLLLTYSASLAKDIDETGTGIGYYGFQPKLNGSNLGGVEYSTIDFSGVVDDYREHSLQRVAVVNAGTHTVSVDAFRFGGPDASALAYFWERSITVLFIPYNASGVTPAFTRTSDGLLPSGAQNPPSGRTPQG